MHTLKLEKYPNLLLYPNRWYITSPMPTNKRYRPGYLNCVILDINPDAEPQCRVHWTDGYKQNVPVYFADRLDAVKFMVYLIQHGTPEYKPNFIYNSNALILFQSEDFAKLDEKINR